MFSRKNVALLAATAAGGAAAYAAYKYGMPALRRMVSYGSGKALSWQTGRGPEVECRQPPCASSTPSYPL
jgi:hypothetical protein